MNIHTVYGVFLRFFRRRRLRALESIFGITDSTRIVDVGGDQFNWQFLHSRPRVHVVNLTKPADWNENLDQFTFEVGDGSALRFKDQEFDVAYSNSVIEHLGSWQKQVLFAREMTRVAKRVYVQTPAQEFFIEPHLLTPFIHWFPELSSVAV